MPTQTEVVYFAGGCLWGVQEYLRYLPGVVKTEAGRANGATDSLESEYDGYAECVRTRFDPALRSLESLIADFFEVIDPYSINKQGNDVGPRYRTGIYSLQPEHLKTAKTFLSKRSDAQRIVVEIKPLLRFVRSAEEHQDRLQKHPNDYCHIPPEKLRKYRPQQPDLLS